MKIDILTLFPEMFDALKHSILARAEKKGLLEINTHNIRDFSKDKHLKVDDTPFGGGAGMVMMAQPIASAVETVDPNHEALRIFTSPKGQVFCQGLVKDLATKDRILLLCGHYEGVDQRVLDLYFDTEISIGDYVLTGGELPAMVITDAVSRYIDGVISSESLASESFSDGKLEYPQYTKPREFKGLSVPEVLLSGNHAEINKWREEQSKQLTKKLRPDLIKDEQ